MDDLLNKLESEKNGRFKKAWSKLEKGNKLNRLNLFIVSETTEKELNDEQVKILKKLLASLFEKGVFNKSSEIEYCAEDAVIISITNLNYNSEKNEYSFTLPKKTIKPVTKSKSKIDRHFSRSKENK
jgi:hypothetical protein